MSNLSPTVEAELDYRERIVVLLGGGLDGYAVLLHLAENRIPNVLALHVDYGQVSAAGEYHAAKIQAKICGYPIKQVSDHDLIHELNPKGSLIFGDEGTPPVTFGRNLVLMLHAARHGQTIYLGLDKPYHGGVPYFDCTLEYFNQAVKLTGNPFIRVAAPFIEHDKLDVCLSSIRLDPEYFGHTFTCWTPTTEYSPDGHLLSVLECGKCKHCLIKAELKQKVAEAMQEQPHPQDEDPDHFKRYDPADTTVVDTMYPHVYPADLSEYEHKFVDESVRKPHDNLTSAMVVPSLKGPLPFPEYKGTPLEREFEELLGIMSKPDAKVVSERVFELSEKDLSLEEIERIMQQPVEDEEEGQ